MKKLTQEELDRLMNQPIYSWDTSVLLGALVDYLEFSESNLALQRERDLERARVEGDNTEFESKYEYLADQYRAHLIDDAEYRFDISLSQSIRYGGLIAFLTTLEMCAKAFERAAVSKIASSSRAVNEQIHILSHLNSLSRSGYDEEIKDIRKLIHIRNCIVHAGGFLGKHKFKRGLTEEVESLEGFSICTDNFLGTRVRIEAGAVERYARAATNWIPKLQENCIIKDILHSW